MGIRVVEITDISEPEAVKIILRLDLHKRSDVIILQSLAIGVEDDKFIININDGRLKFEIPLDKMLDLIKQARKVMKCGVC